MGKSENSGCIAASDVKVGRCRQLIECDGAEHGYK